MTRSDWDGGRLCAAHWHASPNHGPRPTGARIDLVVVHSISLPPGHYGGPEIAALFDNTLDWDAHPYFKQIEGLRVSAHFLVRRDGAVWQFVDCDRRAWHAGASHWRGRGDCNDDSIGVELEGLEGERFEAAQYEALVRVIAACATRYPIRHVAGHEHIAPGRKNDPGPGFDWRLLMHGLGWPRACFPAPVLDL